jgi:hypothetical protein
MKGICRCYTSPTLRFRSFRHTRVNSFCTIKRVTRATCACRRLRLQFSREWMCTKRISMILQCARSLLVLIYDIYFLTTPPARLPSNVVGIRLHATSLLVMGTCIEKIRLRRHTYLCSHGAEGSTAAAGDTITASAAAGMGATGVSGSIGARTGESSRDSTMTGPHAACM